jgi:signal transduction histidine kinase/CheY-like chemotaxis protein
MWPDKVGWAILLTSSTVFIVIIITYSLLTKNIILAQVVWQAGLGLSICLAMVFFRNVEIAFLFSLLPFMAFVMLNITAGIISEIWVILLVLLVAQMPGFPPLSISYRLEIIGGGAITGLLGLATTQALLTVTKWSLYSYEKLRQNMEEIRNQQVEHKEIQDDLVHANQELARLTDKLRAVSQEAEEARRVKEEFVSNVSHELRTPLNMIIGFSELIAESPHIYSQKMPQKLLADINTIKRNSLHLAKLVNDVLDLSQVEAGRMAIIKEWISLHEIIEESVLALRPFFISKGLYLETDISDDIPSVFIDSTRINQVLVNLVNNAGRFTLYGGVRIRGWLEENKVIVSVSDTGKGLSEDDLSRIFEPFQQLDNSIRRSYGGSGLGLSISRKIIELHGGNIWVESQVGVGSTFSFSIPLEIPLPTQLSDVHTVERWINPYQRDTRIRPFKAPLPHIIPRYLILEDGNELQHLFKRYLHGVEIVSIKNYEEAVDFLKSSPAQALIFNSSLNKSTQILLDHRADLPYGIPTIICSISGESEAANYLKVTRYLVKPITREKLVSALESLGNNIQDILIVDDSHEVLQLFTRMLSSSKLDYQIIRANNGPRALELLRERKPSVMLLDLIMPGMNGYQVLEEKNNDPSIKDIPVVVITSTDPSSESVISRSMTILREGGFNANYLLECIQALTEILSPFGDQAQPESFAE